jgi:uncharacterized protein (TIGR03437 family)
MRFAVRSSAALFLGAVVSFCATFGTVVPLVGGAADLVLDEARSRLYLVNTSQSRIEIYSIAQKKFLAPISTEATPLSAALSRDHKYLYVTAFDASALDIIDLDALVTATRVSLPAKPEGVAVGADSKALISTIGNLGQNVLLIFDPNATTTNNLASVAIAPSPPANPTLPPPSGRIVLANHSQLLATPDGTHIVGVNIPNTTTLAAFVYEVASGTVLRSRTVTNVSSVLAVSPDGSRFMAGLSLFDTQTLNIVAQENLANAPYPIAPGTNFNTQTNQGGSVFAPDGSVIYAAFDIAPTQVPAARANISQMMLNDPDNLYIRMGLQLPENLAGKMIISSDGATIYALSESGFVTFPIGALNQFPIANPASSVVLLAKDQCGVTAAQSTGNVAVNNAGKGRLTVNGQVLQFTNTGAGALGGVGGAGGGIIGGGVTIIFPGGPGGVITTPTPPITGGGGQTNPAVVAVAPSVRAVNTQTSNEIDFTYTTSAAALNPGTVAPTSFLIQSPEAVNIPATVTVFQNFRNSEAQGTILPIPIGNGANEGLIEMAYESRRNRLYIANSGLNRVEVFDVASNQFMTPIKVGQLPHSVAITPDGSTMYVANTGGENISIVDLDQGTIIDRVQFPPLPFNVNTPLVTPSVIAASMRGAMVIMSNGTIWKVVGNQAVPVPVSTTIGSNTLSAPRTMAASPEGQFIVVLAGNGFVYLYDALADSFVQGRQVFNAPIQGYFGPVAAGPSGQYFLANSTILNQSLTPIGSIVSAASTTPMVSAVAAVGANRYVRFIQPVRANANTSPTTAPTVDLADATTGLASQTVSLLEGPTSTVTGTTRVNVSGRTMAVDSTGTMLFALTTSGLSISTLAAGGPTQPGQGGPGGGLPSGLANVPLPNSGGIVNLFSYLPQFAPGSLVSIFGNNLGDSAPATSTPLPAILGGTCVTLNNQPLPLFLTSAGQINAEIPPTMAAGRYPLVVRSISKKAASPSQTITIAKYAPAIFTNPSSHMAYVFHADGRPVTMDNKAERDEPLVMYAIGLGATHGGTVAAGKPSPTTPLATTDPIELYFGDPSYKQAAIIVDFSGLAPGLIGLYQINLRVPGFHMKGDNLPVTLKIGGIASQSTGPAIPVIAVD